MSDSHPLIIRRYSNPEQFTDTKTASGMSILLFVLAVSNCEISSNHNKKLKSYTLLAATRNKSTRCFPPKFSSCKYLSSSSESYTTLDVM